jgi:hypothetical protein
MGYRIWNGNVLKIKLLNIHFNDYIQVNYEMIFQLNLDISLKRSIQTIKPCAI